MAAFEVTTEAIAEIVLRTARPCRSPTSRIVVRKPGLAPATSCLAPKASAPEAQKLGPARLGFPLAASARLERRPRECASRDGDSLAPCCVQGLLEVALAPPRRRRQEM